MMTKAGKETYKTVPWTMISGMRNKLIHEYFDIRLNVVWKTIQDDIPSLTTQLEAVVPPDDENENGE